MTDRNFGVYSVARSARQAGAHLLSRMTQARAGKMARLAGVPKPVLERAKEILRNLEESELTPEGTVRQSARRQQDRDKLKQLAPAPQLDLFS